MHVPESNPQNFKLLRVNWYSTLKVHIIGFNYYILITTHDTETVVLPSTMKAQPPMFKKVK